MINFTLPFSRPSRRALALRLLALLAGLICLPLYSPAQNRIITWGGNLPDWDKSLGLSALRLGCSSAPQSCLRDVRQEAARDHVQSVFLAIPLNPAPQTLSIVTQYSPLTASEPMLLEIGFDDFVNRAQKLSMDAAGLNAYLTQIAHAVKAGNPRLKFGITMYEDELKGDLPALGLSPDFASLVDYVHLYPHYRQLSEPFANYVNEAKAIFPNAQIIAGVYAYDRRDYLPCTKGGSDHCSNEQELSLFKDTFQQELALLRSGQVSFLEFYPGGFGLEEQWRNWDQPRICSASRRQECVSNTKAMRQAVLQILGSS
jgi:hypothetical protein